MSATMDVDHFSQYFNNAPVLYIEGRQFPIRVKIIVMSATMDVDHFSQYFNNAPVLYIEGHQFPIRVS